MLMNRSCGIEGFKNARKSTSIAAQATGISLGTVRILAYLNRFTNILLTYIILNLKVTYIY